MMCTVAQPFLLLSSRNLLSLSQLRLYLQIMWDYWQPDLYLIHLDLLRRRSIPSQHLLGVVVLSNSNFSDLGKPNSTSCHSYVVLLGPRLYLVHLSSV